MTTLLVTITVAQNIKLFSFLNVKTMGFRIKIVFILSRLNQIVTTLLVTITLAQNIKLSFFLNVKTMVLRIIFFHTFQT